MKSTPYFLALIGIIQILTLAVMIRPEPKQELVCRGLFSTPNAIRCYEQ